MIEQSTLPPGLEASRIEHHARIGGSLSGDFLGETVLAVHRGELVALTRGSVVEPFVRVGLCPAAPPARVGSHADAVLRVTTSDGEAHELPLLLFDVDAMDEVLGAGARIGGAAPAEPAGTARRDGAPAAWTSDLAAPAKAQKADAPAPDWPQPPDFGTSVQVSWEPRSHADPASPPVPAPDEPYAPEPTFPEKQAKARTPSPPEVLAFGPGDVPELVEAANRALLSGRFALARQALESLANVATGDARTYAVLAECADLLAGGNAEAVLFKLREEVRATVAPAWTVGKVAGYALLSSGRDVLAAAAFASAALHNAQGDEDLARRAEDLRRQLGLDEEELELCILEATVEHYGERVRLDSRDRVALRVLARARGAYDIARRVFDASERRRCPMGDDAATTSSRREEEPPEEAQTVDEPQPTPPADAAKLIVGFGKFLLIIIVAVLLARMCAG